ncbi:hypothetical protein MIMGU_mgv1a004826mg [Erythranthe guttata]|uniref:Arf-GAP domain-containing protein n=1 Tax=Erythranthe guttata TaxID=4155 RepID=A0A022R6N9_ERYGU|nr:hypothetical protein MIMGU_mgv1a004826mg [Erythranthe guttata]
MSSSKREEERNEKIVKGLLKLPPNRRCINCNNLGPQYVCTNFWTFICITCSGIHREFTHRVKSVSMAKFTSQEVDSLQKGGNQRARELYLKAWDPQRNKLPDNSNVDKVREFIKNVYVDKKYSVENSSDKPPKDPQSLRTNEDEMRRASSYHSFSQSPPYDFQYEERRNGKHAPALTRKPGSDRGVYEGKLAGFLGPTLFGDGGNDDRCRNEGSCPRLSDYSVSGGSPFSEASRDISNGVPNNSQTAASVSGTFDSGLDLFSTSFASQNLQSAASSTEKTSDSIVPNNGGWATFDTAPNVDPTVNDNSAPAPATMQSSDGNVFRNFNPFSIDRNSSHQDSVSTNIFGHEVSRNFEPTLWNAFDGSDEGQPIENVVKDYEKEVAAHCASDADKFPGFSVYEDKIHSFANDHRPINPFDLPYDSDMESSYTLWNMSSLEAALPNSQVAASSYNQSWFQMPINQIPNIHAQGSTVAYVGGNPFA